MVTERFQECLSELSQRYGISQNEVIHRAVMEMYKEPVDMVRVDYKPVDFPEVKVIDVWLTARGELLQDQGANHEIYGYLRLRTKFGLTHSEAMLEVATISTPERMAAYECFNP